MELHPQPLVKWEVILSATLSAPLGSGIRLVADLLEKELKELGYEVTKIKLSQFIEKIHKSRNGSKLITTDDHLGRYRKLQKAGTDLRNKFGGYFLAELAITKIARIRLDAARSAGFADEDIKNFTPPKRAYIIDQLKHREEVAMLRKVYGNLFYLIGVFASEELRIANLEKDLSAGESRAQEIMERDREESDDLGQQLDKTLKLSDLFIRNSNNRSSDVTDQLGRFLSLLHGENGITPNQHEYAMYAAYSAGLRSACLSRQVGAAITDSSGNILSTGCNDVPKARGGLYSADSDTDNRCYNQDGGKCHNDERKNLMQQKIALTLQLQKNSEKMCFSQ